MYIHKLSLRIIKENTLSRLIILNDTYIYLHTYLNVIRFT